MGRQPRAGEQQRRPPGVCRQHDRRREAPDQLDQTGRDEVHAERQRRAHDPEVEVAGHREVVGELRVLEVAHAPRPHARLGEPVVEPCRGAVAEVGADRGVDRRKHLEQHEHGAGEGQRRREVVAALDRADEQPHRDREDRRQHAAQGEHDPPRDRERAIGLREDAEELPLLPLAQQIERSELQLQIAHMNLCPCRV